MSYLISWIRSSHFSLSAIASATVCYVISSPSTSVFVSIVSMYFFLLMLRLWWIKMYTEAGAADLHSSTPFLHIRFINPPENNPEISEKVYRVLLDCLILICLGYFCYYCIFSFMCSLPFCWIKKTLMRWCPALVTDPDGLFYVCYV